MGAFSGHITLWNGTLPRRLLGPTQNCILGNEMTVFPFDDSVSSASRRFVAMLHKQLWEIIHKHNYIRWLCNKPNLTIDVTYSEVQELFSIRQVVYP